MGLRKIDLHIDSAVVVQMLLNRKLNSNSDGSLVLNIPNLMELDWEAKIAHAYRETNKCADALTNIGCQLGREIVFYEECPPQLRELVQADAMGITIPRMISL
jgi:hypothetical protein